MDQQASPQLDPKLQEAYDRVMGIQVPPTNPTPQTPPTAATMTTPTPSQPNPVVSAPAAPTMPEPTVIPVDNASLTQSHTFVAKKGLSRLRVSPVIVVVGGIAFLLVYTVIWIKIFNLSVPFINQ